MNETVNTAEKKEAVDETIRDIIKEKSIQKPEKKGIAKKVLFYVFLPFTAAALGIKEFFRRIKIPLTAKMAGLFSIIFFLILLVFVLFYLSSIEQHMPTGEGTEQYLVSLRITSVILLAISAVVFASLITVSSSIMLNPIRKMSNRIDEISSENLSARLENIDSQDELRELTDRINDMLSNLEESFERQQNFVADASHELKTPIAVIQGYSNLLKRWGMEKPDILAEGIESICRESENMKRIIDQLLLLARLGKMNTNKTEFGLYEALDDMVEGYRVVNTTHKIAFWGDENLLIFTDKNLLLESVRTLVDNAVKYTPPGGEINVRCDEKSDCIEISVTDNGVGIAKEDINKVFDRFYRCDKARGRETGSSGLGLTIAKSIVEMLGGEIKLESMPGKGSTFTINLYFEEE